MSWMLACEDGNVQLGVIDSDVGFLFTLLPGLGGISRVMNSVAGMLRPLGQVCAEMMETHPLHASLCKKLAR